MNRLHPFVVGLCAAAAVAQSPISVAQPTKVPSPPSLGDTVKLPRPFEPKHDAPLAPSAPIVARDPAERPLPAASARFQRPEHVVHDLAADGTHWAHGRDWKAAFDGRSFTFVPYLGGEAPRNQPLQITLAEITAGGTQLPLTQGQATRTGARLLQPRGACTEQFDLHPHGVEQSWVFATLPNRGELRLQLDVGTELSGSDLGADLEWRGPHGGVRYAGAVAIDARGARLPLALDLVGERIELVVPAEFVASAVLPLVVDPFTSTVGLAYSGNFAGNPDLAFDYTTQEFLVVWQFAYSATDHDLWAQRLDLAQNPVGTPFTIDFTSTSWTKPRVANNGLTDQFLVVAECSQQFTSPRWIGGRMWSLTNGLGAPFDVERAGNPGSFSGDALNPDVGGDPLELGPTYFTVVWEREYSPQDHDILGRQVTPSGILRGTAPTVIDVTTRFQAKPRISKSNGYSFVNNFNSQRWAVVYEDHYTSTDVDVRGTLLTWDGQLPPNGANHPISSSSRDERTPVVSSPTEELQGPRVHLVAWTAAMGGTDSDVMLAAWDHTLTVVAGADLQSLENAGTAQTWPQFAPSVDSDGARFLVGYTEAWRSSSDLDAVVSVVALNRQTMVLRVHEARTGVLATTQIEGSTAIASAWSGGGGTMHYGVAAQARDSVGTHIIHATVFRGHSNQHPLPTLRSTGCGGLGISMADVPALGRSVSFYQTDNGPLTGFVFGFPTSVPIGQCPGCTLGVSGSVVMNPFGVEIPMTVSFVGIAFAAQAWSFYSGNCLGSIAISDTIDFTIL
jgi:hypothetical protein